MKSKKAKEYIESNVIKKPRFLYYKEDAITAVEIAEQEMLEKVIEAFNVAHCEAYCDYGIDSDMCKECRKLNLFINQLKT